MKWVDLFGLDPEFECLHEWVDLPEADMHMCGICGEERLG